LADPDITLEKLIQIAKSMELSEVQADGIENANRVTKKTSRREINQQQNENQQKSKCWFCGYQHVLGKMSKMESFQSLLQRETTRIEAKRTVYL